MIPLEDLYFEWLLTKLDPDGVTEGVAHICGLLHNSLFRRRVGNDINRAVDGADLRKDFLNQYKDATFTRSAVDDLMDAECSWLEMLIALATHLDYIYEGGVQGRFIELLNNMRLGQLASYAPMRSTASKEFDQRLVDTATSAIDRNRFTKTGHGALFPLRKRGHQDQREVEIWEQAAAYFREIYEGAMWTSTR